MRPDYPRTEEGLQAVLAELERARIDCDGESEGHALLSLSYLVKWVRSDNGDPPFDRSQQLALQAVEVFRARGDRVGEARALCYAISPIDPKGTKARLKLAEAIAKEAGDMKLTADVTAALARASGMGDPELSVRLYMEALALYEELDDKRGMAGCHFGLSIKPGISAETRQHALDAWRLYRESGDPEEGSRALSLSVSNSKSDAEKSDLEPYFMLDLEGALTRKDVSATKRCYKFLAEIIQAKGDTHAADEYRRLADELRDPTELPPEEQHEMDVALTRMLLEAATINGNAEAARTMEQQLAELMRTGPRRKAT